MTVLRSLPLAPRSPPRPRAVPPIIEHGIRPLRLGAVLPLTAPLYPKADREQVTLNAPAVCAAIQGVRSLCHGGHRARLWRRRAAHGAKSALPHDLTDLAPCRSPPLPCEVRLLTVERSGRVLTSC
jgi:hypothetical protein